MIRITLARIKHVCTKAFCRNQQDSQLNIYHTFDKFPDQANQINVYLNNNTMAPTLLYGDRVQQYSLQFAVSTINGDGPSLPNIPNGLLRNTPNHRTIYPTRNIFRRKSDQFLSRITKAEKKKDQKETKTATARLKYALIKTLRGKDELLFQEIVRDNVSRKPQKFKSILSCENVLVQPNRKTNDLYGNPNLTFREKNVVNNDAIAADKLQNNINTTVKTDSSSLKNYDYKGIYPPIELNLTIPIISNTDKQIKTVNVTGTVCRSSTVDENEDISQKIEHIGETPIVIESDKNKIEGFNVTPPQLNNIDKTNICNITNNSARNFPKGGQSEFDSIMLKEMENTGIPLVSVKPIEKTLNSESIKSVGVVDTFENIEITKPYQSNIKKENEPQMHKADAFSVMTDQILNQLEPKRFVAHTENETNKSVDQITNQSVVLHVNSTGVEKLDTLSKCNGRLNLDHTTDGKPTVHIYYNQEVHNAMNTDKSVGKELSIKNPVYNTKEEIYIDEIHKKCLENIFCKPETPSTQLEASPEPCVHPELKNSNQSGPSLLEPKDNAAVTCHKEELKCTTAVTQNAELKDSAAIAGHNVELRDTAEITHNAELKDSTAVTCHNEELKDTAAFTPYAEVKNNPVVEKTQPSNNVVPESESETKSSSQIDNLPKDSSMASPVKHIGENHAHLLYKNTDNLITNLTHATKQLCQLNMTMLSTCEHLHKITDELKLSSIQLHNRAKSFTSEIDNCAAEQNVEKKNDSNAGQVADASSFQDNVNNLQKGRLQKDEAVLDPAAVKQLQIYAETLRNVTFLPPVPIHRSDNVQFISEPDKNDNVANYYNTQFETVEPIDLKNYYQAPENNQQQTVEPFTLNRYQVEKGSETQIIAKQNEIETNNTIESFKSGMRDNELKGTEFNNTQSPCTQIAYLEPTDNEPKCTESINIEPTDIESKQTEQKYTESQEIGHKNDLIDIKSKDTESKYIEAKYMEANKIKPREMKYVEPKNPDKMKCCSLNPEILDIRKETYNNYPPNVDAITFSPNIPDLFKFMGIGFLAKHHDELYRLLENLILSYKFESETFGRRRYRNPRNFDPWVPIPSWPEWPPKPQKPKELVCPKEGCNMPIPIPAQQGLPCKLTPTESYPTIPKGSFTPKNLLKYTYGNIKMVTLRRES